MSVRATSWRRRWQRQAAEIAQLRRDCAWLERRNVHLEEDSAFKEELVAQLMADNAQKTERIAEVFAEARPGLRS